MSKRDSETEDVLGCSLTEGFLEDEVLAVVNSLKKESVLY